MVVMELLTPQLVDTRGEKMAAPIALPAGSRKSFLVTLNDDEVEEIDRQNEIMHVHKHQVLQCIFRWGFVSLHNLRLS